MLFEKILCLIDLGGEIRAAASIGMVQQHELSVLLSYQIFREASFAVIIQKSAHRSKSLSVVPLKRQELNDQYLICKISAASLLFMVDSKPPL